MCRSTMNGHVLTWHFTTFRTVRLGSHRHASSETNGGHSRDRTKFAVRLESTRSYFERTTVCSEGSAVDCVGCRNEILWWKRPSSYETYQHIKSSYRETLNFNLLAPPLPPPQGLTPPRHVTSWSADSGRRAWRWTGRLTVSVPRPTVTRRPRTRWGQSTN